MAFADKDLHANLEYVAIAATAGAVIDMQGYRSVEFVFPAAAALTVTLQYGDEVDDEEEPTEITDAEDVDPESINGTLDEDGTTADPHRGTVRVGYIPERGTGKRYIAVATTAAGIAVLRPLALPTPGR